MRLSRGRGPVEYLRVARGPYLLGYCRSVEEVAQHVDLAQLVEPAG